MPVNVTWTAVLLALAVSVAVAQGVDPSTLLTPSSDSWLTYHGDYSGQRHSQLTQITPDNVHRLGLAWAFQTGQNAQIKGTPILANGIVYVTTPDNLWALDVRTGRQIWRYTYPMNDGFHIGHRGAAEVPVLIDADFGGTPRKMLLQASRNGYFFVLDRTNGKSLLTAPFATVNWASGIDQDGRPIPNPAKEPARDGRLVAPNEPGGTNYRSPGFDPKTGLLIVSAQDGYGIYFFKPEHGAYGWAGANYVVTGKSYLRAIDYQTGKIRWSHYIGDGAGTAGVLTTASGVTFTGDNAGNVLALRSSDGTTLWHSGIGRVGNGPITYELEGRQYLLVGGGSGLYAFALPEERNR